MSARDPGGGPSGRLYVCDLDGTLLRSDGTLSAVSRHGLNRLLDAGAPITFATARSLPAVLALLAGVRLRFPLAELNGAFVSDPLTGRHLGEQLLTPEGGAAVARACQDLGLDPVITTWDGAEDHIYYGPRLNRGTSWFITEKQAYRDPRLRPSPDPAHAAMTERVAVVSTFVKSEAAPEAAGKLGAVLGSQAAVTCTPSGYVPGWSEIHMAHPRAHKGTGVALLRTVLGRPVSQLTVLGDHLNDLSMFDVADRAVAPANARPEVLQRAHEVVGTNDADGVMHFLLREFAAGGPGSLG